MQSHYSKYVLCTLLLTVFTYIYTEAIQDYDPLLVVTIMIKNEEHVIEKTLAPFLERQDSRIAYLILDTGSTDNTVQATLDVFQKYNARGFVAEKPFVNFAVSRNDAIKFAEEKFPYAGFFLMIDAEWYVQNVSDLLDFCEEHKYTADNAFLLKIGNKGFENFLPRLFRPNKGLRFEGVVHEYLNTSSCTKLPGSVIAIYDPSAKGREQSQNRWKRDAKLLYDEHKRNPEDPRSTFYLAQTYACLGDLENAKYWYQFRTQQQGWDQENYMAFYRLGGIFEALNDWPNALFNYLKAYSMRPWRVEPLIALGMHYLKEQNFVLAFMFSKQAVGITPRPTEVLFVDKVFYDFTRYDLLGMSAWYVGEYEIGEKAVEKALLYAPDAEHLEYNLSLYKSKKITK
jgi:glycosyltransferase involved in cell wall biosynthesis